MYRRGAGRFTQSIRPTRVQSLTSVESTLYWRGPSIRSETPICRYSSFPWSIADDNAQKNKGDVRGKEGRDSRTVSQLILRGLVKSGQTEKAVEMLAGMKEANIIDWTMVIGKVAKTPGQIDHAFTLLREMKKVGLRPNLYTYSVIMDGCFRAEKKDKAFQMFEEMKRAGFTPDENVYTTIIAGLARNKDFGMAKQFCEDLEKMGELSSRVVAPLIDAYTKSGDMSKALTLFNKGKQSIHSYSSIINGYMRQGNIAKALEYFEAMKKENIKPDAVLYNVLMDGYLKKGQIDKAFEIFEQMKEDTFPDLIVYFTLIDGCMKGNQPQRVPALLKEMQKGGFDVAQTNLLTIHPTIADMLRNT